MKEERCKVFFFIRSRYTGCEIDPVGLLWPFLKPALVPVLTLNRLAGIRTLLVLVALVRGSLSGLAQRTTPFIVARVGLRT